MTQETPDVSERLAQVFANWQMYYLGHEIEVLQMNQRGLATKQDILDSQRGARLADVILDNRVSTIDVEEWRPKQKFSVGEGTIGFARQLEMYATFPFEMFQWNRNSRRVFHVPHSLEAMLAAAEFRDMKWKDILWPFESFIVTIEKPIVVSHPLDGENETFDTIMVTRTVKDDGSATIRFRWMQAYPKSSVRLGLTPIEMRKFRHLLAKKPRAATKLLSKKFEELFKFSAALPGSQFCEFVAGADGFENIIVEPEALHRILGNPRGARDVVFDGSSRSFFEGLSVTIRLIAGLMLYLESLSDDSTRWRRPIRKSGRLIAGGTPAIITEPDQICDIVGKGRIDPSEVSSDSHSRSTKGFVRPHWRRAHYRRPQGSEVTAPKTVRVPPVLVRADLVPLYGVVGGTSTVIISK